MSWSASPTTALRDALEIVHPARRSSEAATQLVCQAVTVNYCLVDRFCGYLADVSAKPDAAQSFAHPLPESPARRIAHGFRLLGEPMRLRMVDHLAHAV